MAYPNMNLENSYDNNSTAKDRQLRLRDISLVRNGPNVNNLNGTLTFLERKPLQKSRQSRMLLDANTERMIDSSDSSFLIFSLTVSFFSFSKFFSFLFWRERKLTSYTGSYETITGNYLGNPKYAPRGLYFGLRGDPLRLMTPEV